MKKKNILFPFFFASAGILALLSAFFVLFLFENSFDFNSSFLMFWNSYGLTVTLLVTVVLNSVVFFSRRDKSNCPTVYFLFVQIFSVMIASVFHYISYKFIGSAIIKLLYFIFVCLISSVISNLTFETLSKNKSKLSMLAQKNRFTLGIFIFFVFQIFTKQNQVDDWVRVWYVLDYKIGFSSRLLPGTILHLFTGDEYISRLAVKIFLKITLVLLSLTVSIFLGKFLNSMTEKNSKITIFLSLFYLVSPFSIAYLWHEHNFGRMETFSLLFILVGVYLFLKIKNTAFRYIALNIFWIIGMLCYQGSIFLFFPIVFTVTLCDCENKSKKNIAGFVITIITVCASFLFVQFASSISYSSIEALKQAYDNRTDMELQWTSVKYEYFSNIIEAYKSYVFEKISDYYFRLKAVILLFIISPVLIVLGYCWTKIFVSQNREKIIRTKYFWIFLSNLAIVPQFLLNIDRNRWAAACLSCVFFEIAYFIYINDPSVEKLTSVFQGISKRAVTYFVIILLYVSVLPKFGASVYPYPIDEIITVIMNHT